MIYSLKNITVDEFIEMSERVSVCMKRYAKRNNFVRYSDYDVYEPYNGWSQVLIDIFNLRVLNAKLVAKLRRIVKNRPGWEIVVSICVREHLKDWPDMGLRIRAHEVVDGLQRSYLPPEFRSLAFEAARPGVADD